VCLCVCLCMCVCVCVAEGAALITSYAFVCAYLRRCAARGVSKRSNYA
jgi:hypothetical protein